MNRRPALRALPMNAGSKIRHHSFCRSKSAREQPISAHIGGHE